MDSPYLSLSLYTTHTLPVPHDGPRSLVEVTRLTLHLVPPLDVSAPTAHTPHATVRDGDPARVFRCHVPTLVLYSRVYPVACHVCHEWRCVWLSLSFFNVTEAFSEAVTYLGTRGGPPHATPRQPWQARRVGTRLVPRSTRPTATLLVGIFHFLFFCNGFFSSTPAVS